MDIRKAYDEWSAQYDENINPTRDLEAVALREVLLPVAFESCLELGCGTGKNTEWLITKAKHLTAVDLSASMLEKAKQKITSPNVDFICTNITTSWPFPEQYYDVATCSLMLEHIEKLEPVFECVARSLNDNGYFYIGELHPFKQYSGSKARFDSGSGIRIVDCYLHHLTDYYNAAKNAGLRLIDIREYFDAGNSTLPRLLVLLFRKENISQTSLR